MQVIRGNENALQRTDDWRAERLGKFSASQIYRLMTEPKAKADKDAGNLSEGAKTYVLECVAEILTGIPAKEDFSSKYTEWGVENEPFAKGVYAAVFECVVVETGYIAHSSYFGGSPDGLISEDGALEIKCPYTITSHLQHLRLTSADDLKKCAPEYYWQCLAYLIIAKRQWIDFVSYHPKYPAKMQLKRLRIKRENVQDDINQLIGKVERACVELQNIINYL